MSLLSKQAMPFRKKSSSKKCPLSKKPKSKQSPISVLDTESLDAVKKILNAQKDK
jgi:hypothetical protein